MADNLGAVGQACGIDKNFCAVSNARQLRYRPDLNRVNAGIDRHRKAETALVIDGLLSRAITNCIWTHLYLLFVIIQIDIANSISVAERSHRTSDSNIELACSRVDHAALGSDRETGEICFRSCSATYKKAQQQESGK
ncbi:MAG: hypothetical protein ABW202_06220 [Duganella sp.]